MCSRWQVAAHAAATITVLATNLLFARSRWLRSHQRFLCRITLLSATSGKVDTRNLLLTCMHGSK